MTFNLKTLFIILSIGSLSGCHSISSQSPTPSETDELTDSANSHLVEAPSIATEDVVEPTTASETAPEQTIAEPEPEPVPPEFWNEVRAGFALDQSLDNKRITVQRNWYAKHPAYVERVLQRGEPYLYFIYSEIKKRDMPMELVLLPIVESAFDPFAYSHGRASGIWQFIPGTGKAYGLKQTWWYDGRRDIVAATGAALDYLEALNKQFNGNWLHALAAYNSGAGNVRKGIRYNKKRGRPTDFWSLKLPKETKAYVPKLIALANIFKEPEKYGITLRPIAYEQQFVKFDIGSQIDLSQAAQLAGIELNEMYRLNPGFNRWATDPDGPHHLLIPTENASEFEQGIATLPPEKRVKWARYTIKSGDALSTIAKKHHTTMKVIKDVNNIRGNRIVAGKTLLIPQATQSQKDYALSLEQRLNKKRNRPRNGGHKVTYTVKNGDSFWTIAKNHKVNHRSLAKWNGMAPTDTLRAGQSITIWTAVKGKAQNQQVRKINYRARNGDSYARIAQKFNVTLGEIKRWNTVDAKKYLQPGDLVTLYVDVRQAP